MTCGICAALQKQGLRPACRGMQHEAACQSGEIPGLKKENEIYRDVFKSVQYGLVKYEGGYDFNVLSLFFAAHEAAPELQRRILDMINIIICALEDVRAAERAKK